MKNKVFNIEFDEATGGISSLVLNDDETGMNWVIEKRIWGLVRCDNYNGFWGDYESRIQKTELVSFKQSDNGAESLYSNGRLEVTVKRSFTAEGALSERYTFKNISEVDLFLEQDNCSITFPFSDKYTYAADCLVNRCNTHIWCGHNTAYINALKMGPSPSNIGVVLTEGACDSYSMAEFGSNIRGVFYMNLPHRELLKGEQFSVAFETFECASSDDFYDKIKQYNSYVGISAKHFTVFENEEIEFDVITNAAGDICAALDGERVEVTGAKVRCKPSKTGAHRVWVKAGDVKTYADFYVSPAFDKLLKKRLDFIVENQQYRRKGSNLDGAFLIYDNTEGHVIFDDNAGDHNACNERIGMALLLAKYLQDNDNSRYKKSLMRYVDFLYREFFDPNTGRVYGSVGKRGDRIRLYDSAWVAMLLAELYLLTGDNKYLKDIVPLLEFYYANGGGKFYPNAFSVKKIYDAFAASDLADETARVHKMFARHVENMIKTGTDYPKHEVNFEQTIVSPAATFLSEWAALTGEEKYKKEAKKHIEILRLFNGRQPSFRFCEIPIRYWDDFWFGKSRLYGDTMPHYWSCLSAHSFADYYNISGEAEYLSAAEECMRNCLCLFFDDGKASCAYMSAYSYGGKSGNFYDEWANDQDFALYFALETGLATGSKRQE